MFYGKLINQTFSLGRDGLYSNVVIKFSFIGNGVNMRRYWEVELKDGTIILEGQLEWREVPKRNITRLSLFYDGRRWDLTDKESYFVKHRASMVPGIKESFRIERRTIGFYEGANKICYHVDEDTGRFSMEVIDNSE